MATDAQADQQARDERRWQDALRSGLRHLAAGLPVDAISVLDEANSLWPDHIPILRSLAAAHLRAGHASDALAVFATILATNPRDAEALQGKGLALHLLEDRENALNAFRCAVTAQPHAWRSLQSIADITPCEEERLDAIGRAATVLCHLCEDTAAQPILFFRCMNALLDAGRDADAVGFVRQNFARFDDQSTACACLARACYETGNFRAALEHRQDSLVCSAPGPAKISPRPPFKPDAAVAALLKVFAIFQAGGVTPFLAAGTLLGFHRNGGPLVYDRDVDIGVLSSPGTAPDIYRILREDPGLMLARRARPNDRYFALDVDGTGVDVFIYEERAGKLHCGLGSLPGDIAWRFSAFGLKKAVYGDRTWTVPDNPDRYLAETYGPGWRTPDRAFASVLSSPALFSTDPYARAYYALIRAETSRRIGDVEKARRLLQQSPLPVLLPQINEDTA